MTKQTTDHSGKLSKEKISDFEVIQICLNNAPEGVNKKQVAEILKILEGQGFLDEDDGLTYEYEGEGGDFFSLDEAGVERLTSYVDRNPVQVTLEQVGGELIFAIDPKVWAKINEDN